MQEDEEEGGEEEDDEEDAASCFAICHCHGCTACFVETTSSKVVAIILDCFHLLAPDSSLGIPAQSEFRTSL